MASGPVHYQLAEKLLKSAEGVSRTVEEQQYLISCAQVHATLAMAAAVALYLPGNRPSYDSGAWMVAASNNPSEL